MQIEKAVFFGNPRGSYKDKFNRIAKLVERQDELSRKFDSFMSTKSITERGICAAMCKTMLLTGIRIGNEDSAEGYISKREGVGHIQTFGLTTLKPEHVKVIRGKVILSFTGKRGIEQLLQFKDVLVAKKFKALLTYSDEYLFPITDYQMRKFIKTYVGGGFKSKDFRTLYANIIAWDYYSTNLANKTFKTQQERKAKVRELVEYVAGNLGNTPAMARRAYIDPRLLEFTLSKLNPNN